MNSISLLDEDMDKEITNCTEYVKELATKMKVVLAVKFLRYFKENPEAVLFIHSAANSDKSNYNGDFIARLGAGYVRGRAKEVIANPYAHLSEHNLICIRGDVTYKKDLAILQDGERKSWIEAMPKAVASRIYSVPCFSKIIELGCCFENAGRVWNDLALYEQEENGYGELIQESGMIYVAKDEPSIAATLGVNYKDMLSQIESQDERKALMKRGGDINASSIAKKCL